MAGTPAAHLLAVIGLFLFVPLHAAVVAVHWSMKWL